MKHWKVEDMTREELIEEVCHLRSEVQELDEACATLASERRSLASENDNLRPKVERLEQKVQDLESHLSALRSIYEGKDI